MHELGSNSNEDMQLVYPDLNFGYGYANFQPGDDPIILVKDVLSSLFEMEKHTLPEIYPEGVPAQPVYYYNSKKAERIENFMKQKIASPLYGEPRRKEEILDIPKALETVMDALGQTNHPVAQALVAMNADFRDRIPQRDIDFVTLEVLKQTHWNGLRDLLNIQIAVWRLDQSISGGAHSRKRS